MSKSLFGGAKFFKLERRFLIFFEKIIVSFLRKLRTRRLTLSKTGNKTFYKKPQRNSLELLNPDTRVGRWKYPADKFEFEKPILLKETNIMGNTYYDNYLSWQGEARERLLLMHPSIAEWLMKNKHIKMITHSVHHKFLNETTFGDVVKISVSTKEIKSCSFIMRFTFANAVTKAHLGDGWQRICFMDLRTNKLSPVPQLILDLIQPLEEDAADKMLKAHPNTSS